MEILVIFIIAWIVSPLVLIPLVIHNRNKCYKNCNENTNLRNLIQSLIMRGALNENEKELYYKYIGTNYNKAPPIKQEVQKNSSSEEITTNKNISEPIFKDDIHIKNTTSSKDVPKEPQKQDIPIDTFNQNDNPILNNAYYMNSTKEKSIQKDSKVSTISIILIVGVIFVLLSGIIFTTTTWHSLNNIVRSGLIFSASILFFGVSALADKKLKLEKTGMAFFSIGSFLLPIDIFAIGIFNLFGEWLSWGGDGKYLLGAIGCSLFSIASYVGTKKYNNKFYAIASLFSISGTFGLIGKSCLISVTNNAIFTILIALYLLFMLLLQDKIKNFLINLEETYSQIWDNFFVSNIFIMGLISLITINNVGILSGISMICMFIVFLGYANQTDNNNVHYIITSLIFLIVGSFLIFREDNIVLMISVMITFIITILLEIKFLNYSIKNFYSKILLISLSLGAISLLYNTLLTDWYLSSLISIILAVMCSTWIYFRKDFKFGLYLQSFYMIFLACNISFMMSNILNTNILIISIMIFIFYLIYQFVAKLQNDVTLISYTILVGLLTIDFNLTVLIIWFLMLMINLFKDDTITSKISKYVLPLSMFLIVLKVSNNIYTSLLITFFITLIISIGLTFKNVKNLLGTFTGYSFILGYIYHIATFDIISFDYRYSNILVILFLTMFSIFKIIISKKCELDNKKIIYTNISLINLLIFSTSLIQLDISSIWISFGLSIILFISYYVIKSLNIDDDILKILKYYTIAILEISQWYICLTNGHFVISLLIVFMNFIFAYNFKNNILTLFSIINLYYILNDLIYNEFIQYNIHNIRIIFNVIFFVAMGLLGRYLHKEFIYKDKETKKFYLDYFTIFAIFPIFKVFIEYTNLNGLNIFLGFVLLSIYPLFYYNRILINNSKQILLSISSIMLCFVFWSEPFISNPKIIENVEFNCLPIISLSLILCLIWKKYPKVKEYSPFISLSIVSAIISIWELIYRETFDIISLMILCVISVILSIKLNTKKWKTLSIIIFCVILWIQPFFIVPEIVSTEWNCLPLIILSISISFIWIEYPKIMEYLPFGTILLISLILSVSAISSQEIIDAFILLFSLILILVISFMIKRKKWFCFSTIELILLTIYLTRNFWLSIAWWVYLLVVGLLMISIGATNEYLKIKNENLKDNIKTSTKRLFQDWKW